MLLNVSSQSMLVWLMDEHTKHPMPLAGKEGGKNPIFKKLYLVTYFSYGLLIKLSEGSFRTPFSDVSLSDPTSITMEYSTGRRNKST